MANVTKKSTSRTNLSAFSMNTQAVAKPVTPIKTKAAYKLYPPSILNGTGLKNNKRRKRGLQRSCTRKDSEELTPPMAKKGKDSPLVEESQPLMEQPTNPIEDRPTTCEASTMTDAEEVTPPLLKKGKYSPPVEEPQPLVDQTAKPAEDRPTTCEASTMTDPEEVTLPVLKMEETQPLVDQPTTCEASTMTDAEETTPPVQKERWRSHSL
ncbi:testis-specific gene A8 protein-like [Peromyscus leucopus]|uniref:testis-specific gene A8 protein-like n=1 Tax=Peromyscus leucopus TaxID=10041 RepID=UPI0010A0C687|nr:testis-specific gene A8 protein-like [Peromyscus leucopus]